MIRRRWPRRTRPHRDRWPRWFVTMHAPPATVRKVPR